MKEKGEVASVEGRKKICRNKSNLSDSVKMVNVLIEAGQITQVTQRRLK